MKPSLLSSILAAASLLLSATAWAQTEVGRVSSPNGQLMAIVSLTAKGTIQYSVQAGEVTLVSPSSLGIKASNIDFNTGLTYQEQEQTEIDERYELPTGKQREYTNHCHELTLTFKKGSRKFGLVVRAYDDGVAYRYVIPGSGRLNISSETCEMQVAAFEKCWAQKYQKDYSVYYPARGWDEVASLPDGKMCFPALIKQKGTPLYMLYSEAANNGDYCATALKSGTTEEEGRFGSELPATFTATLPLRTPWKALIIGRPADIVASTMMENLNPPTAIESTDWISSGLSSWDWGGMDGSQTRDLDVIHGFIDMAQRMGWPFFTLDDGWDGAGYALEDVVSYAKERGVSVWIWSNHNRFQNDKAQIRGILAKWKNLGFVGTKIDFFEDDRKEMMEKYEKILQVAGELKMMVNFHGCLRPSGLRRTYPHLITSEAVWGGEMYFFSSTATPATHNITLAMTRNVIGPMDYTPVEFSTRKGVNRHLTTWSHQVALAVVYESGIQTVSDCPANILSSPARGMLRHLPARWDETRCLEAEPDQYVTMARRNGDDWYIGTISASRRTVKIPLTFLGEGTYTAQIVRDGTCPSDMVLEQKTVRAGQTLTLNVVATGGATVRISQTPYDQETVSVYECENGTKHGAVKSESATGSLLRGGSWATWLGGNASNYLTMNTRVAKAGLYELTIFYCTHDQRDLYVRVAGGEKVYYSCPGNGFSWNSDGLACMTVQVELKAGANIIEFGNDEGYAPNLDRIVLMPADTYNPLTDALPPLTVTPEEPANPSDHGSALHGTCYDLRGMKIGEGTSAVQGRRKRGIHIVGGRKVVVL